MSPQEMQQVKEMFSILRKHGILARMNLEGCASCGWAALDKLTLVPTPAVFFHRQDDAHARSSDDSTLAIRFGYTHDESGRCSMAALDLGRIVCSAASGAGLEWTWKVGQCVILEHAGSSR